MPEVRGGNPGGGLAVVPAFEIEAIEAIVELGEVARTVEARSVDSQA